MLRRIVLPQRRRHAMPAFANHGLVVAKATARSIMGPDDAVHRANQAVTHAPFTFYEVVAQLYRAVTRVSFAAGSATAASCCPAHRITAPATPTPVAA